MRYSPKGILGLVLVSAALLTSPARADTFSMSAGMPSNGGTNCFQFGDNASGFIGVQRLGGVDCSFHHWVMPIHWRNFFSSGTNRTIRVYAKRPDSSSTISCTAFSVNSAGNFVSSASGQFTTIGSYSSISLTINQVSSTGSSFVSCFPSGSALLLSVDYTG
jgi:hypothetical protein